MKRGDVVLAAATGDYGKPRPWVVVQSNLAPRDYPSVTLCPVTTFAEGQRDVRIRVEPTVKNGLRGASQILADKVHTLPRERVRAHIGEIDTDTLRALDTAVRVWLGLA